MSAGSRRAARIVLGLAAGLVVLFGGQWLYRWTTFTRPLQAAMASRAEVESYRVDSQATPPVIQVRLRPVANLQESYRSLEQALDASLGSGRFRLEVADRRDAELTSDYYRLNLVLAEGLATGHFLDMDRRAQQMARTLGLRRLTLTVDERYLYVTMVKGSHYLYELVPRAAAGKSEVSGSG
ncbi:MAG: hypothetical protein QJR14_06805 [Bacillota bacterium]|nr:hypothetical protein [Bacillota bacterium]